MEQVDQRVPRAERNQDAWRAQDRRNAEDGDDDKPCQHHRPENGAHKIGSVLLNKEQPDQDYHRDRDDHRSEIRRIHLEPFHGAEHRDGGRYDAVPVQECRSYQAHDEQRGSPTAWRRVPRVQQGQQGNNPAFAVVVRTHDKDRVFQRDDQDQGPEDQRDDAQHRFWRRRSHGLRRLLQSVECTGPDIPVHNTERTQCRRDR